METDLLKWFAECGHEICGWPEWETRGRKRTLVPLTCSSALDWRWVVFHATGYRRHTVEAHEALCIIEHHVREWFEERGEVPPFAATYDAALIAGVEASQSKDATNEPSRQD